MSDYISREELSDNLCVGISCNECSFNHTSDGQCGCLLQERVDELSKADVRENIHGTWEEWKGKVYANVPICSNCKHGFPLIAKEYNFCPHCGADMRGET